MVSQAGDFNQPLKRQMVNAQYAMRQLANRTRKV